MEKQWKITVDLPVSFGRRDDILPKADIKEKQSIMLPILEGEDRE